MTHFLKFPDEKIALVKLKSAGFVNEEDKIITASHSGAIDVVGIISQGGEYDLNGNMIVAPVTLDGWHINFQGELPTDWKGYVVTPESPVRMFFGNFGASGINTPSEEIGG